MQEIRNEVVLFAQHGMLTHMQWFSIDLLMEESGLRGLTALNLQDSYNEGTEFEELLEFIRDEMKGLTFLSLTTQKPRKTLPLVSQIMQLRSLTLYTSYATRRLMNSEEDEPDNALLSLRNMASLKNLHFLDLIEPRWTDRESFGHGVARLPKCIPPNLESLKMDARLKLSKEIAYDGEFLRETCSNGISKIGKVLQEFDCVEKTFEINELLLKDEVPIPYIHTSMKFQPKKISSEY